MWVFFFLCVDNGDGGQYTKFNIVSLTNYMSGC